MFFIYFFGKKIRAFALIKQPGDRRSAADIRQALPRFRQCKNHRQALWKFPPRFLWVFSCPCFLCSYTEIYFLRFPPPSRGLMISGSWRTEKGKRVIIRGKERREKKKGKGKYFTVNLYFSKIYRTPSPPCCRDSICQSPSPDSETE